MTNREIKFELLECLVTINYMKNRMKYPHDFTAMETIEGRLVKLVAYFKIQHQNEIDEVNNQIDKIEP